jgi:hypothetical protein
MSDNRTNINDLNEGPANAGELTENEIASVSGGVRSGSGDGPERLPTIDTIHADGRVTADIL